MLLPQVVEFGWVVSLAAVPGTAGSGSEARGSGGGDPGDGEQEPPLEPKKPSGAVTLEPEPLQLVPPVTATIPAAADTVLLPLRVIPPPPTYTAYPPRPPPVELLTRGDARRV